MMGPLRAAVRKAHALGVTIAAATDGSYADGTTPGGIRVAHEIAMLREFAGMTPLESITAATLNGARVLGIESRTGTIRVGPRGRSRRLRRRPARRQPTRCSSRGSS